jgi:hypothetical protein
VTSEALSRYNKWLQLAKLDTKKWQLDGMKWILFHELCAKPAYGTISISNTKLPFFSIKFGELKPLIIAA